MARFGLGIRRRELVDSWRLRVCCACALEGDGEAETTSRRRGKKSGLALDKVYFHASVRVTSFILKAAARPPALSKLFVT